MSDIYQWNRTQADKFVQELKDSIHVAVQPNSFDDDCLADPQRFYLRFKNLILPVLESHIEKLKAELHTSENCHYILLKQTRLVDQVIETSLNSAIWYFNRTHNTQYRIQDIPIAIAARKSYCREETYFWSDIDIQVISKPSPDEALQECLKSVTRHFNYLFVFQDLFLTSASCNYTELEVNDKELELLPIATFYSMLYHRFVAGDLVVYNEFTSAVKTVSLFRKEEILDYCSGHRHYYDVQNTVFQQEPNVKEELRRLYWALALAKLRHSLQSDNQFELLLELYNKGKISGPAFKNMQTSLNFLSRVRLILHCHQRGTQRDALTYEVREKISQSMGFEIKAFYKEYFYNAVYPLKRYSRNLFWESLAHNNKSVKTLSELFGINADNQIICHSDPDELLGKKPEWMFKIFTWVADKGCYLSYPVIRAIEKNVDQVTPIFIDEYKKREVQIYFEQILKGKFYGRALRLLHEFGLLANYYIPEFQKLCGLLQDIYIHQFPTDVHILIAMEELNKLTLDPGADPFLVELYQSVRDKITLKLSVLLHDIGKGAKKPDENEELVGSRMIPGILENLGFKHRRIHDVAHLVEKHLMMWDLMQLDPDEDETYELIWDLVHHDKERLKMLILLTYADRGGTKIKMSTSQIQQLKLFYQNTIHHKRRATVSKRIKHEFLEMIRLPRDLQIQLEVYNEFIKSKDQFVAEMLFKSGEPSDLILCTRNQPGIVYKIAAILAFNQINIVDANIHTRDGNVFDTFRILTSKGQPIDFSNFFYLQKQVKEDMKRVFVNSDPLAKVFGGKILPAQAENNPGRSLNLKVKIIGRAVKLETPDILGTFMMESKVFSDMGLKVQRAVLHTQHETTSNVFYLRQIDVEKIFENEKRFKDNMKQVLGLLTHKDPIYPEQKEPTITPTSEPVPEKTAEHIPLNQETDFVEQK